VIDGIGEDFEARRFYWLKLSCWRLTASFDDPRLVGSKTK
jgi:hypothetical protein